MSAGGFGLSAGGSGLSAGGFGLSAGGLGFSGALTSILWMILPPLQISFVLIFSGQQHTTLIITALSFSWKAYSFISLVHKIHHQNQNEQLSSSSFQHCPQPQNASNIHKTSKFNNTKHIYKTLTRNFTDQFPDLLATAFTP